MERNLFYVKGKRKHYDLVGSWFNKSESEYIAYVSGYDLDKINTTQRKDTTHLCPMYSMSEGDIDLFGVSVLVTEYRPATADEIRLFDEAMARHNLVFKVGTYSCIDWTGAIFTPERRKAKFVKHILAPYYIRKADFKIVLNGKEVTFKWLKRHGLSEGEKVILHGDNGYSHWWSRTYDGSELRNVIDQIFDRRVVDDSHGSRNNLQRQRKAVNQYSREVYGWNFDKWGRLVVNTTMEEHNFSQVSDS